MNFSIVDPMIKKTITPKASVNSLLLCMTSLSKKDMEMGEYYLDAIFEYNPYLAIQVAENFTGKEKKVFIDRISTKVDKDVSTSITITSRT